MPTITLLISSYRLLLEDHQRLSAEASRAVLSATRKFGDVAYAFECSQADASELWTWFDDCEKRAVPVPSQAWKVMASQLAKDRIDQAR